ncbi:MAG: rhodanese-like domain-containing protein [Bacteroidales bacterium]|nr:rhodanese-like domain-containing protein [Bacteroidales bacterium]
MAKFKFWMLSIFTISVLLVSCGKTVDESMVLAEYLESAESPIDVAAMPKYITAAELHTLDAIDGAYIIDIRSGDDYGTIGHIEGAVNVAAADVISHLADADFTGKQVVIACYTGQTAAFVTSLVNMSGYSAKSLLFGMSSWNEACAGSLNSNSTNTYESELVTEETAKGDATDMPVLETGLETGAEILDAQIATVNTAGFIEAAITSATVFGATDNYYIVNYWSPEHYALGHIPGAMQYTPNTSLLTTADLKTLPTDKTIVVYCYTGQTSAFVAAYLKVLGYDAKSLKFGMNGMATDWAGQNGLTSWGPSKISGYDLVKD